MADRFQPSLTSDAYGLHAIWYERVINPSGGPDLIRTDRNDLSLFGANAGVAPLESGEQPLSTVPWQFLPKDETGCYAGDYIQVFSNGVRAFAAWTDLRNTAVGVGGATVHDSDVFSDGWTVRSVR